MGTPKELCDCSACVITRRASKEGPCLEDPRLLLVERLFVLSELPDPNPRRRFRKRLLLFGGIGKGIVVVLWFFNLGNEKFKFFDSESQDYKS